MPEWMRRILYDSDGGGGGGGTGGDGGGDDGGGDDSGGDDSGKKPPKSVPYARFREVGEKVKGLEGGLAERDKTIGDLTTRLETLEGRKDPNADPNAGTDDNLRAVRGVDERKAVGAGAQHRIAGIRSRLRRMRPGRNDRQGTLALQDRRQRDVFAVGG